eukprot:gene26489-32013_t
MQVDSVEVMNIERIDRNSPYSSHFSIEPPLFTVVSTSGDSTDEISIGLGVGIDHGRPVTAAELASKCFNRTIEKLIGAPVDKRSSICLSNRIETNLRKRARMAHHQLLSLKQILVSLHNSSNEEFSSHDYGRDEISPRVVLDSEDNILNAAKVYVNQLERTNAVIVEDIRSLHSSIDTPTNTYADNPCCSLVTCSGLVVWASEAFRARVGAGLEERNTMLCEVLALYGQTNNAKINSRYLSMFSPPPDREAGIPTNIKARKRPHSSLTPGENGDKVYKLFLRYVQSKKPEICVDVTTLLSSEKGKMGVYTIDRATLETYDVNLLSETPEPEEAMFFLHLELCK